MNEAGWMHCDVSVGNCLLCCDPEDGPSLLFDMEFSKNMNSKAPASKTAISVSSAGFQKRDMLIMRCRVLHSSWRGSSSNP
jgi:hypothetical protein